MSSKDEQSIQQLKQVPFFQEFAEDQEIMNRIFNICSRKSFREGRKIIEEGDYGDELFIVLKGTIEIVKKTLQNERYTVTSLNAGMGGIYVGEIALIDNDRRSATVTARTECECLVINRKNFIRFGDENPKVGLSITRSIASRLSTNLRKANQDVITLFSALVEEISDK